MIEDALIVPNGAQGATSAMRGMPAVVGSAAGPRRRTNEDRAVAATIHRPASLGGPLFVAVVCDGIGGQRLGAESASLATASFLATCALTKKTSPHDILRESTEAANKAVHALTAGSGGTTLVGVVITAEGQLAGVNCGDSRIFVLDRNEPPRQLSHDQTLGAAIRKVAAEATGPDLGEGRFEGELANFIGIGPDLQPEFLTLSEVGPDDAIVLASDGTWNALGDAFSKFLHAAPTYFDAVRRVLATVNFANGPDNASLIIVGARSEVVTALKAARVRPEMVRLNVCAPVDNFAVVAMLAPISYGPRTAPQPMGGPVENRPPAKISPPETPKTSKPPPKPVSRARRGKHKGGDQAALDLGSSGASEKKSSGRKRKTTVGKVVVVEGGDGNEDGSTS